MAFDCLFFGVVRAQVNSVTICLIAVPRWLSEFCITWAVCKKAIKYCFLKDLQYIIGHEKLNHETFRNYLYFMN